MDIINLIEQVDDEITDRRGLTCRPDDTTWSEVVLEIAAALAKRAEVVSAITPEALDVLTDHNRHTARAAAEMVRTWEPWKVFRDRVTGAELTAYTMRGTFSGEEEDTRELIAHDHGIAPDNIDVTIELRA